MKVLQAYESFLMKVNRNDSNSNIYVPRGKFILIYNEQAKKWLSEEFPRKEASRRVDRLNDLLVPDKELTRIGANLDNIDFVLPDNFYDSSSSFSIATKGRCERIIDNWEMKSPSSRVLLTDENNRPSFEFEETLFIIANGKVKVYFDGFKIKKVYLSYYKFPKLIDMEGYVNLDGEASKNIDPDDIDDDLVNEIISRAAIETIRNSENPDAFPFAKDRINTED